jgi:hypothetical protein
MMKPIVANLGDRYLKEITRSDPDQFRIALLTKKSKRIGRPLSPTSVVKLRISSRNTCGVQSTRSTGS